MVVVDFGVAQNSIDEREHVPAFYAKEVAQEEEDRDSSNED